MLTIDLNSDLGESFGVYTMGNDAAIMDYVSSVNIACGFHAGDPAIMRQTVQLAISKGVAIGAHPGLPDLVGFGRRPMTISPDDAYAMVIYQVGALLGFVQAANSVLRHVKPHGALYNMASVDAALAHAIAQAVYDLDPSLILFGLAGSELIKAGRQLGLTTASEVFADRTYQDDGSLTPRYKPHCFVDNQAEAIKQALMMIKEKKVCSRQGNRIDIQADTLCVHGDHPDALALVRAMRKALHKAHINVECFPNG